MGRIVADALELLRPVDAFIPKAGWPNVRIARDVDEIALLKRELGEAVYVAGGPGLVATLMNAGLIDELRLIVQPVLLGGGMPLFRGVQRRRALKFVAAAPGAGGRVNMTYRVM